MKSGGLVELPDFLCLAFRVDVGSRLAQGAANIDGWREGGGQECISAVRSMEGV